MIRSVEAAINDAMSNRRCLRSRALIPASCSARCRCSSARASASARSAADTYRLRHSRTAPASTS